MSDPKQGGMTAITETEIRLNAEDAEVAAREEERVLRITESLRSDLSEEEAQLLHLFAGKLGEAALAEHLLGLELDQEVFQVAERAYGTVVDLNDQIVAVGPTEELGKKRARRLGGVLHNFVEFCGRGLIRYPDPLQPVEERLKAVEALNYIGSGFRDGVLAEEGWQKYLDKYMGFVPTDRRAAVYYLEGFFIGRVGMGDPEGITVIEKAKELTSWTAPDYYPTKAQLNILHDFNDAFELPVFKTVGSCVPLVNWVATLEQRAGLDTNTKARFDEVMKVYGYRWVDDEIGYAWSPYPIE